MWLFLNVPWVGLHCMIVVFPDHTHFLGEHHVTYVPSKFKVCAPNGLGAGAIARNDGRTHGQTDHGRK